MPPIRDTQRAPLSCAPCAARKVKCSKDIPCKACIARGVAAECRREVVRVRGKLRTADSPAADLSYAELLHENARLSALIGASEHEDEPLSRNVNVSDRFESQLWEAVGQSSERRTVREEQNVQYPSRTCSDAVVARAGIWTSWIHYAFFFPRFREEHEQYWASEALFGPLWRALYFSVLSSALLFMDDTEYEIIQPPRLSRTELLKNWYEAALYYLDEADFLQNIDLRVVQAITILGIVATNIGDTARHSHLWAVAVRMAQALKLGMDHEHRHETLLEREVRRRLWWTLVICEWLPIPVRTPCISLPDFKCKLPAEMDDDRLLHDSDAATEPRNQTPKPVQYHIAMSKVSIVVNRFRATLHARPWSASQVAQIVSSADEQLASLIVDLPEHLQSARTHRVMTFDEEWRHPWIVFQRTSLTLVLLHHRIVTNRVLQSQWLEGSSKFNGSRSMCLNSAIAIIHVASSQDAYFSRLRPW